MFSKTRLNFLAICQDSVANSCYLLNLKSSEHGLVFRSFESCIYNTQAYVCARMYAHICWDSRTRKQWIKCTFNISLHFVTLCHLRGNNQMRSRVVPCHVLIILFQAGRLHSGGFQHFQTEQILLIIDLWLTFRVYFRCFFCLIGIDLWWIPDILCHALFQGVEFSRIVIYWP